MQVDNGSGPYYGFGVGWKLVNRSNGSVVGSGDMSGDRVFTDLPGGDYQLEYTSANSKSGAYDIKIFFVPDPQVFDVSLATTPLAISDGVPGAGAGNIETVASKDIYRFTVPAGGRSVQLDNGSGPYYGYGVGWKLVNRSNGSVVGSGDMSGDRAFADLPGGDYQLEYTSGNSKTGAYDLKVSFG